MTKAFQHVIRKNDDRGSVGNDEFQTDKWRITGVRTKASLTGITNQGNVSEDGVLFVTLTGSGTQVAGRLYNNKTLGVATSLVATFTATNKSSAFATITAANSSGLGGEVRVKYNQDQPVDDPIELQVVYTTDQDLYLYEQVHEFQAYDETLGVSRFHNEAAWIITDYISHKFRLHLHGLIGSAGGIDPNSSFPLFSQFFISAQEPDIARVHNPMQLRRASAFYTLYLLYNHDFVGGSRDPNQERADMYLSRFQQEISTLSLDFDTDKDGDVDDVGSPSIIWARG